MLMLLIFLPILLRVDPVWGQPQVVRDPTSCPTGILWRRNDIIRLTDRLNASGTYGYYNRLRVCWIKLSEPYVERCLAPPPQEEVSFICRSATHRRVHWSPFEDTDWVGVEQTPSTADSTLSGRIDRHPGNESGTNSTLLPTNFTSSGSIDHRPCNEAGTNSTHLPANEPTTQPERQPTNKTSTQPEHIPANQSTTQPRTQPTGETTTLMERTVSTINSTFSVRSGNQHGNDETGTQSTHTSSNETTTQAGLHTTSELTTQPTSETTTEVWKYTYENGMLTRNPNDCPFGSVVEFNELNRLSPHLPDIVGIVFSNTACVYQLSTRSTYCGEHAVRSLNAPYVCRL